MLSYSGWVYDNQATFLVIAFLLSTVMFCSNVFIKVLFHPHQSSSTGNLSALNLDSCWRKAGVFWLVCVRWWFVDGSDLLVSCVYHELFSCRVGNMLVNESLGETFDVFWSVCGRLLPLLLAGFYFKLLLSVFLSYTNCGVFICD